MAIIDFDPIDYIDEISTKSLVRELETRRERGDGEAYTSDDRMWREWVRLADLIAEGDTKEALYLLATLSPVEINPIATMNFVQTRMAVHHA